MEPREMIITKECCDWLNPIVKDLPDTSYEQSAVDAVLNHVMKLEQKVHTLRFHLGEIADSDLVASNLKNMARNAIR